MPTMRACGCGLRTVWPQSIPGGVEVARVRELAGDLRHRVVATDGLADRPPRRERPRRRAHRPRRHVHRVEDLLVPGAAAEVARERLADLVLASGPGAPKEILRRDDEPGRAEAALHRARLRECRLHRVQLAARREPLHGHDLVPVRLRREHEARAHERRRRGARSTSRTRPARTRSSTRGARGGREARRAGSRRPRRRPRAGRR